jgi:hypothetical protein
MKTVNFLLAILFLIFAFVQINDPDPILWIIIYGNMAVLCILAMFKMYFKYWNLLSVITYAIYAGLLFKSAWHWLQSPDKEMLFDDIAKMQNIYIEETREFLGLLICLIVLVVHFLTARKTIR